MDLQCSSKSIDEFLSEDLPQCRIRVILSRDTRNTSADRQIDPVKGAYAAGNPGWQDYSTMGGNLGKQLVKVG